jgi:hypothetical protein
VSLDNLTRAYGQERDISKISRFVDTILGMPADVHDWADARNGMFFCFEPSDHAERSDFRMPLSDHVDRVPVHWNASGNHITWLTQHMLDGWQISLSDAIARASENMAGALAQANIERWEAAGGWIGSLTTETPFKAALILAPNLKEIASPLLGWPLLAVFPDRDFLFLWDAANHEITNRVGHVVVEEFNAAPYPLTTEVFRIDDDGIAAIGAFPRDDGASP